MKAPALLALLLLAPVAAAQVPVIIGGEKSMPGPWGGLGATLRVDSVDNDRAPILEPWFLVGSDTVVNLTLVNDRTTAWNGTFRVNVTGATASEESVSFALPPHGRASRLVSVHADDPGRVAVLFEGVDAFLPDGQPMAYSLNGPALLMPSVRFVDPPVPTRSEDDEYEAFSMYGGQRPTTSAFVRVAPGDYVRPRVEVRNTLAVATPEFMLTLEGGRTVGPVLVRSLEPGQSTVVELPEFMPAEAQPGGGRYFGSMGTLEFRAMGEFQIAGASVRAHLASYRIENGALAGVAPAVAYVEVQDGLSVETLVPREPRLGVPARVKLNVSNDGRDTVKGTLVVTLNTPNGYHYGVQGPEARSIHLDLTPGERLEEVIEFTPRVTGQWTVGSMFRSAEGFGYGGGGAYFTVDGPVRITFDRAGTEYARIGERVQVDLVVQTDATLADAALAVASGTGYRGFNMYASAGEYRPGLTQRLLDVETTTSQLGTLRPGGALNVTLEVAGRGSGRFDVIPFVLSEGFAYTSRPYDPARDPPSEAYYGPSGVQLAVQPRPVPAAMALAPLTVGLAVFVGTWTLRTRFVK
ncbi:MAG TPA: hypothetical protein VNX21_03065 [Candidatus Thermoplasmatota archaeon]|nr:hypothetical protein [Candidatus Thermoplasmatota archaeon]